MKITIDLDAALLEEVRRRAAREGKTMKAFFEESVLARLRPKARPPARYVADLPVVEGVRPPAVDVTDRRALHDFVDEHL